MSIHTLLINGQDLKNLDARVQKYCDLKKYDSALVFAKQALSLAKKEFGKKDTSYADRVENLGLIYIAKDDIAKADSLYSNEIDNFRETWGDKSEIYIRSIVKLAIINTYKANYIKSEELYTTALKLLKDVRWDKKAIFLEASLNLANNFNKNGRYKESEALYIEALDICKELKNQDDIEGYSTAMNGLASIYTDQGLYNKAEPLYLQAIDFIKSKIGNNNEYYLSLINNLSILYGYIGNYKKAELYNVEALELVEKLQGKKSSTYATYHDNLAVLYLDMKEYDKAEPMLIESLNLYSEIFGQKDDHYAFILSSLGQLYSKQKKYAKAIEYTKKSLDLIKDIYGEKSTIYGMTVSNLGVYYYELKNYKDALLAENQALYIFKEIFGENNIKYINTEIQTGIICLKTGNIDKAEEYFIKANEFMLKEIERSFSFMSEKEQYDYLKYNTEYFDKINSFALNRQKEKPEIAAIPYNNELLIKGALLQARKQMNDKIINSGDTALTRLYSDLKNEKEKLSKLYSTPLKNRNEDVKTIEEQANRLEKELYNKSSYYKNIKDLENIKWEDIRNNLKTDEIAIEFIKFNYFQSKLLHSDSIMYCAILLKKDYKYPRIIPLFEVEELMDILNDKDYTESNFINKLYSKTVKNGKKGLYELIWKPLEKELTAIKTIYISPAGMLNKISFAAIVSPDNKFLCERYKIENVYSSREIVLNKENLKITNGMTAAIYGGIRYNMDTTDMKQIAMKYKHDLALQSPSIKSQTTNIKQQNSLENTQSIASLSRENQDSLRGGKIWSELNSTLAEADKINMIFKGNKIKSKEYKGEEGTEESFKALESFQQSSFSNQQKQSPTIIHIATHGYFFPELKNDEQKENTGKKISNVFINSDNPLMRSGLILAGANRVWKGEAPLKDVDDGILTADEVSNMNLGNTKLVTLSACETALGDIKGSEGVFGLQRAFKMAGVDYIIMSLWKVSNVETEDFMETFYKTWLKGKDICTAFSETQTEMMKKFKEPFKWAAFELVH